MSFASLGIVDSIQEKVLRLTKSPSDHESTESVPKMTQWPRWSTLRSYSRISKLIPSHEHMRPLYFRLRIEPSIPDYTDEFFEDIHRTFEDTIRTFSRIRRRLHDSQGRLGAVLEESVAEGMIMAVVGSNAIEGTGCSRAETTELCVRLMKDDKVLWSGLSPWSREYKQRIELIIRAKVPEPRLRARREAVNSMAAFCYLVEHVVGNSEEFSEHLIKRTHAILVRTHGMGKPKEGDPAPEDTPQTENRGGRYRQDGAGVASARAPPAKKVAFAMRHLVRDVNRMLRRAEKLQELDPFFVAARAAGDFATIQPFCNGNGRLACLIMNAILLKYVGIAVPMGVYEAERIQYRDIRARRLQRGEGDGELTTFVLMRAHATMRAVEASL